MSCIYTLHCEHDCYYIGRTIDIVGRFNSHKAGFGAVWTKAHRPLAILELVPDGPFQELVVTLCYMKKYGLANVRGGPWCNLVLSQGDIDTIQKMLEMEGFARPNQGPVQQPNVPQPTAEDVNIEIPKPDEHEAVFTRSGYKWDNNENSRLLAELSQALPLETISRNHGRSEGAIRSRVSLFVRDLAEKGISPSEICRQLNLTERDVQQALHKRNVDLTSYLQSV
jgi:hypothetical protein